MITHIAQDNFIFSDILRCIVSAERRLYIPAPLQGQPVDSSLDALNRYVITRIGVTPTKYATEENLNCPPLSEVNEAQRLMSRDHKNLYTNFPLDEAAFEVEAECVPQMIEKYRKEAELIPEIYGVSDNKKVEDYLDVGVNRYYELIKEQICAKDDVANVGLIFIKLIENYITQFNLPSWQAARYATRLLKKQLPQFIEKSRDLTMVVGGISLADPRLITRFIFTEFSHSEFLKQHYESLKEQIANGHQFSAAFNFLLKEGDVKEVEGGLALYDDDFTDLCTAYHLAERPYTKEELLVAQELLDNDPHFRAALIIFHTKLVEYLGSYFKRHPERLAYTLEHFTEIFLTAQEVGVSNGEIQLFCNPKLLKVISRNIMPAIARAYIQSSDVDLEESHIREGAIIAKNDLQLFQANIGEFHSLARPGLTEEKIEVPTLHSFFTQTCPAMQPFSNALTQVLPKIFTLCKEKNIRM